jgi:DNA-binding beta-propeller fold protein YncE
MSAPDHTPDPATASPGAGSPRRGPRRTLVLILAVLLIGGAGAAWSQLRDTTVAYEVWSLDQGTDRIHIYDETHTQIAVIDVSPTALRSVLPGFDPASGRTVPHMIDFDSSHRYAFVAATAGGATIVIDTVAREVLAVLETGPGTHMAAVTPDDRAVWVAVIGTREFIEIPLDLSAADPEFSVGRTLDVEALLATTGLAFPSASPVCHDYDAQGRAWITLGPGMTQGGLIVLDVTTGTIVHAFDPEVVRANCGIGFNADGTRAIANWSGTFGADVVDGEGEWYVVDTTSFEVLQASPSAGVDAHGVRITPNGREFWQVNRGTGDGLRIDARTFAVLGPIDAGDTPDILDFSPDGRFVYITQRGPNPLSGDPHVARGTLAGVLVVDVATGQAVTRLDPPTVVGADGAVLNDVHGIGVRPRSGGERVVVAAPTALFLAAPAGIAGPGTFGCHLPA